MACIINKAVLRNKEVSALHIVHDKSRIFNSPGRVSEIERNGNRRRLRPEIHPDLRAVEEDGVLARVFVDPKRRGAGRLMEARTKDGVADT